MLADSDVEDLASRDRGQGIVRGYFRRPEKEERRVALNFKVPETLKLSLLAIVKLWKLRATVEGASPSEIDGIDLTFVCNELLDAGIDGAWEEIGSLAGLTGAPKNDAEWAALQKALESRLSGSSQSR